MCVWEGERTLLQKTKIRNRSCKDIVWLRSGVPCVSWPERCWAGSTRAGCSLWQDRHKQTSARWPWWGWSETSTWTSGPPLHGGGPPLQAQWVTESRCSQTVKLHNNLVTFQCCVCFVFNTCLVLRRHECRKCGSVSSGWMSTRWCKQLAGGQTRCTPAAWRERPHNREGGNTYQTGIPGILR